MKDFDKLPKSIKKSLRYIKQEASIIQLKTIENYLLLNIEKRKKELEESKV
jgi:hypothetical protein